MRAMAVARLGQCEAREAFPLPPAVSSSSMTTRATTAMDTDDKARQASSPRAALLQAQRGETVANSRSFFCLRASRCLESPLHPVFYSVSFDWASSVLLGEKSFLISFSSGLTSNKNHCVVIFFSVCVMLR